MLSFVLALGLCTFAHAQDLVPMHNDKGLFGYGVEGSETFTIKPQWDEARPFNEQGVAIVRKGNKFAIINKQGEAVGKKTGYSTIVPYDGTDYWLVAEGGKRVEKAPKNRLTLSAFGFKGSLNYDLGGAKWGLLDKSGLPVIEPIYQELSNIMADSLIVFQENNKLGVMNRSGVVLFPAEYDVITPFNNQGLAAVRKKKGLKWSLVSKSGKVLVPETEGGLGFYNFQNDYWGSLNLMNADTLLAHKELWNNPERLLPLMNFNITWINSPHPYVATVINNRKVSAEFIVYDLNGNRLIEPGTEITDMSVPSDGVAIVYKDKNIGFYDLNTKTFTPADNARMYLPFKEGYSMTYNKNTKKDFYLVDKNNIKVSENYDSISLVRDRFIVVSSNRFGLISKQGKNILPLGYQNIFQADSTLFGVKNAEGKFGYVDVEGKTVVPMIYEDGTAFTGNYAVVKLKGKSGVINKNNKVIVPIKYNNVCCYTNSEGKLQVWVSDGGTYSYLDRSAGNKLAATEYTEMRLTDLGIVVKNASGLFGLLHDGKNTIPCSVTNEELLGKIYQVMQEHKLTEVTDVEAHRIAAWTNDARNSYSLSDTIDNNIWDF